MPLELARRMRVDTDATAGYVPSMSIVDIGPVRLIRGAAVEVLATLPDNSVDGGVTDPPYGLGGAPDIEEVLTHWLRGDDYAHSGGGFMGKGWDSFVPGPATWREVYRVLKPGAYLCVCSGTRTHGVMEVALRLAGFEIRDAVRVVAWSRLRAGVSRARGKAIRFAALAWMYGSGFPKSLDASKATQDRKWRGYGTALKPAYEPVILARKPLEGTLAANLAKWGTGALNIDGCRVDLKDGESGEDLNGGTYSGGKRNPTPGDTRTAKAAGRYGEDGRLNPEDFVAPSGRWPSNVVLSHHPGCRKSGSHRVESNGHYPGARPAGSAVSGPSGHAGQNGLEERSTRGEVVEAWECVAGCPVAALNAQSGSSLSKARFPKARSANAIYGGGAGTSLNQAGGERHLQDTGGASRFFPTFQPGSRDFAPFLYCAKAPRSEREAGCEALPTHTGAEAVDREADTDGLKSPRAGAGRTAAKVRNHHPTVKPLGTMRWLVRLIAPPGNPLIIDPFFGSGTTAVVAAEEGCSFVGCDLDDDNGKPAGYLAIAEARVRHALASKPSSAVSFSLPPRAPSADLAVKRAPPPHPQTGTPMHVESIKANIKSGTPFEYKLGTHTLIVARNGGGKSSISLAVQLALTGMADDVLGKEAVKSGQVLAQLGDSSGAFAVATLSGGSESTWEVVRDGATVKTADFRPAPEVDVDAVLPLRAVRAAVSGDDKVARATFLRWTSADVTEESVLVELPSMYHERYKTVAKAQTGSAVDVLSAVTAYAGTRVAAAADEVRGQEAILNSIQTEGMERPTDDQIETAQANVRQWEAAWAAALKFEAQAQVRERIAVLNGLAESAKARLDEANINLHALTQALADENPPPATHPAMLAMATLCQQHPEVLAGPGCPVCGTEVGAAKLVSAGAYYAGVAAPSQPSQLAVTAEQWRVYAAQRDTEHRAVMTERAALEKLVDVSLVDLGVTAAQAQEGLTQWRTYEAQLTTAKARWDTVRDARDAKAKLDAEVPVMRAFYDACKDAVARVFTRGVGAFQARVQRYLPARWSFRLQLRDGDKEVFRPGLVRRSGEFDTILSGTEWDSVQVAIAMAVIEGGATVEAPKGKGKGTGKRAKKTGGDQPAVIILSDRDRDEGTLADLMRAWASFPGQVIIEATHKPRGKFPAGWTLIEVEREVPTASEDPASEDPASEDPASEVEPAALPRLLATSAPPGPALPPPGMEALTPAPETPPAAPPLVLPPGLSKPAALPPTTPQAVPPIAPASATSTAALLALDYTEADIATMPEAGRAYAVKYNVRRAQATRYGDSTWTFPPPGTPSLPLPVER